MRHSITPTSGGHANTGLARHMKREHKEIYQVDFLNGKTWEQAQAAMD